jgi:serine/threonine protein kinase
VQSLDRSEEDGDERRGHLRVGIGGGGGAMADSKSSLVDVDMGDDSLRRRQQRRQHERQPIRSPEQEEEEEEEELVAEVRQHQQHELRRHSSTHERRRQQSPKLRDSLAPPGGEGKAPRETTSSREAGGRGKATTSHYASYTSHAPAVAGDGGRRGSVPRPTSTGESRGGFRGGQKDDDAKTTSSSTRSITSSASNERRRLEEYVGRRAMERLERELDDHSDTPTGTGRERGTSHHRRRRTTSVMDRRKLALVPQVKKADLIIGEYLGRGNFCDVFEVTWVHSPAEREGNGQVRRSSLREALGGRRQSSERDKSDFLYRDGNLESSVNAALSCSNDLSLLVIGGGRGGTSSSSSNRSANRRSVSQVRVEGKGGLGSSAPSLLSSIWVGGMVVGSSSSSSRNPNVLALKCLRPSVRAQPRKFVIGAEDLAHETAILACLDHPNIIQLHGRAEGCFSTAFQVGSSDGAGSEEEDEGGEKKRVSQEGYFIILDRLEATLTDRIVEWRDQCRVIASLPLPQASSNYGSFHPAQAESMLRERLCERLKVAYSIADALLYLHSRHVVFRDLKPANVGFDCNDCVKVFDFGFATSIAPLLSRSYAGYGPLTETCGTRRYMAPEVALKLGYGKEVDVYSFGMLLWEVCALDKPFESIQSVDEFHDIVTLYGKRPSLHIDPLWPSSLKALMSRCWSTDPLDRPSMAEVKSRLCNVLRDVNITTEKNGSINRVNGAAAVGGVTGGITNQLEQEQGTSFIHKWRRRISL